MDDKDTTPKTPHAGADNTIALFLGLYLVVLAFFILLVTISEINDKIKAQRVMDSLTSEFTSIVPPTAALTTFQAKDGDVFAGQEFQEQVTGIFATALAVDKITKVLPGRLMRINLKSDSLFFANEARVRPAMYPLLDRVVATMSNRPPGMRYDIEFVIGVKPIGEDQTMPIAQTLELARAGAFAREMHSRGLPPDSVSVGVQPGDPQEVVMWFYTRGEDETRLKFEGEEQ